MRNLLEYLRKGAVAPGDRLVTAMDAEVSAALAPAVRGKRAGTVSSALTPSSIRGQLPLRGLLLLVTLVSLSGKLPETMRR